MEKRIRFLLKEKFMKKTENNTFHISLKQQFVEKM